MTYANVVFSNMEQSGSLREQRKFGMDGLILPDVPFEEKEEFDRVCREYGLDLISLIAPTSHDRIRMIAKKLPVSFTVYHHWELQVLEVPLQQISEQWSDW